MGDFVLINSKIKGCNTLKSLAFVAWIFVGIVSGRNVKNVCSDKPEYCSTKVVFGGQTGVVRVSSVLQDDKGDVYPIGNVFDSSDSSAWASKAGEGQSFIEFEFLQPVNVRGFSMQFGEGIVVSGRWDAVQEPSIKVDSGEWRHLIINGNYEMDTSQVMRNGLIVDGNLDQIMHARYLFPRAFSFRKFKIAFPFESGPEAGAVLSDLRLIGDDPQSKTYFPNPLRKILSRQCREISGLRSGSNSLSGLKINVQKFRKASGRNDFNEIPNDSVDFFGKSVKSNPLEGERLACRAMGQVDSQSLVRVISSRNGRWTASFSSVGWDKVRYLNADSSNRSEVFTTPVVEGDEFQIKSFAMTLGWQRPAGKIWKKMLEVNASSIIDYSKVKQDTSFVTIAGTSWMKRNVVRSPVDSSSYCVGAHSSGETNKNCLEFGRLYPSSVAEKVCPEGWRLPSIRDWIKLWSYAEPIHKGILYERSVFWSLMEVGEWCTGACGNDKNGFSGKWVPTFFQDQSSGDKKYHQYGMRFHVADLAENHKNNLSGEWGAVESIDLFYFHKFVSAFRRAKILSDSVESDFFTRESICNADKECGHNSGVDSKPPAGAVIYEEFLPVRCVKTNKLEVVK